MSTTTTGSDKGVIEKIKEIIPGTKEHQAKKDAQEGETAAQSTSVRRGSIGGTNGELAGTSSTTGSSSTGPTTGSQTHRKGSLGGTDGTATQK